MVGLCVNLSTILYQVCPSFGIYCGRLGQSWSIASIVPTVLVLRWKPLALVQPSSFTLRLRVHPCVLFFSALLVPPALVCGNLYMVHRTIVRFIAGSMFVSPRNLENEVLVLLFPLFLHLICLLLLVLLPLLSIANCSHCRSLRTTAVSPFSNCSSAVLNGWSFCRLWNSRIYCFAWAAVLSFSDALCSDHATTRFRHLMSRSISVVSILKINCSILVFFCARLVLFSFSIPFMKVRNISPSTASRALLSFL